MKLTIDMSGRKGLAKKFAGDVTSASGSPERRYLAKDGEMVQGIFNPMTRYGFLSPTSANYGIINQSDTVISFTNELRATQVDVEANKIYVVENGNIAWEGVPGNTSSWYSLVTGLATVPVGNVLTDIEIYQINGVKTIFMSYNNGTGDILTKTGSTFNSSWLSVSATGGGFTSGGDVFMKTSDNGFMYIFDGNKIHKLDGNLSGGATGTVTFNVIEFPTTFRIVDALDWRGNLWVAVQSSVPISTAGGAYTWSTGESDIVGVYVWDRKSKVTGASDFIPMKGVRDIRKIYITAKGELHAITISSQRTVQIRKYNGITFKIIAELGSLAFPSYRDSFTQNANMAIWVGNDGIIYAHGSITEDDPEGLYMIGDSSLGIGTNGQYGAILMADDSYTTPTDGIIISNKGSIYGARNLYFYPYSSVSSPPTKVYTQVKLVPRLSTINYIDLICAPTTPTTGTFTYGHVYIYLNMSTTPYKTITVLNNLSDRGYLHIPIDKPFVNSVQIAVDWNEAGIHATVPPLYTFLPMYAEIDYTPTETDG